MTATAARLTNLNVTFTHRPAGRDILVACPVCSGRLILDEEKPFFICLNTRVPRCAVDGWSFNDVIVGLGRASRHRERKP